MMPGDEEQQSKKTGLMGEEDSHVNLIIDEVDSSAKKSVFDEDPLKSLAIKSPAKIQSSEVRVEKSCVAQERLRSSTSSTEPKPLPIVLRRIVAAIIDAMIVGFGGALIISTISIALSLASHPQAIALKVSSPAQRSGLFSGYVRSLSFCSALRGYHSYRI
jgi:hypothetical protein